MKKTIVVIGVLVIGAGFGGQQELMAASFKSCLVQAQKKCKTEQRKAISSCKTKVSAAFTKYKAAKKVKVEKQRAVVFWRHTKNV